MHHRRFKFESKWHLDGEYSTILEEAWQNKSSGVSAMQAVQGKLECCQRALSQWSGRKYGNTEKLLKKKTKRLEELQCHEKPEDWDEITNLKQEIEFTLEQEDIHWKQRAKLVPIW